MSSKYHPKMHWTQIKCPFFHGDTYNSIVCEGCSENASVRQTFPNKQETRQWEEKYCFGIDECTECPMYKAANAKYSL